MDLLAAALCLLIFPAGLHKTFGYRGVAPEMEVRITCHYVLTGKTASPAAISGSRLYIVYLGQRDTFDYRMMELVSLDGRTFIPQDAGRVETNGDITKTLEPFRHAAPSAEDAGHMPDITFYVLYGFG